MASRVFKTIEHNCDLCVIGGGLSGMCAAISAARHGLKVVIMQDRPMFGGNTSSEVRMWVCGAHGDNNRETGIIEEIMLENLYCNPYRKYPMWDAVLFGKVKQEKNITTLLNCSCNDATVEDGRLVSIEGWQTTTQMYHRVKASYYSDCSGDSILAPLTGAEYRVGREARLEFYESIAPEVSDKKTMGMSCLLQAVEMDRPIDFIPPSWAHKYTRVELEHRYPEFPGEGENFWYLEIGGTSNSIDDTESLRDELLKMAYGYWDFIKNSGEFPSDNWSLEFVGFLPGKRESRRYVGDYILNQNDVEASGRFDDIIAYGGWTMDDHNPEGFNSKDVPNIFHPAPSPFGIPYRSIYSKNISNLFFAGRNISATHAAMSATRVMATCAVLGQAVGTAAYLCKKNDTTPRGVYEKYIKELKQTLMLDDCYLPYNKMTVSDIVSNAVIETDGTNTDALINGYNRKIGEHENCWSGVVGSYIDIKLNKATTIKELRLVFDSDLNRETTTKDGFQTNKATLAMWHSHIQPTNMPLTLVKDYTVEYYLDNKLIEAKTINNNINRLSIINTDVICNRVRVKIDSSYGNERIKIYSINLQ